MDAGGITAIQARIAQIHARFAMPVSSATAATAAPAGTAAGGFAGALDAELTRGASGASGAARTSDGKPADLQRYGNGRIPPAALESIGVGNHRLWAPAASAFKRLQADARAAGIDIGVTDSYRSYEQQVDVARRKGLYSQGGLAAKPGTSDHGWGLSLDLDLNGRAQSWMRANAGRYGFKEDVPREPWHWTFKPG